MTQKIYKLVLIRGYSEAYYQLAEAEKKQLWERVDHAINQAGAKMATPYYNCRWSNDQYLIFFTMEYPNIDAAMLDTAGVEEAQLFRYLVTRPFWGLKRRTYPLSRSGSAMK